MLFSTSTIIAAAAFLSTTSAAPAPPSTSPWGLTDVVDSLELLSFLGWKTVNDAGGRYAVIPAAIVAETQANLTASGGSHPTKRNGVGIYNNAGNVAGVAASYACETTGPKFNSTGIANLIPGACAAFIDNLPTDNAQAWHVYQSPQGGSNNGWAAPTNFYWQFLADNAPPVTNAICTDVLTDLTAVHCQTQVEDRQTGGAVTQGGNIRLGGSPYLEIGLDPNAF